MITKHFHALQRRIDMFDDDLELFDVLRRSVLGGDLSDENDACILSRVDPAAHTHLSRRQNSDHNRLLTINHLRKTVYTSYTKDIYEELTEYLRRILTMAALVGFDGGRLVGEHSAKMDIRTVLQLGSWEKLCEELSANVFQSLEAERSTPALLRKMRTKLDLAFDEALIDAALPYLEARHLLVHVDGAINQDFRNKYPTVTEQNGKVLVNYQFVRSLRDAVLALADAFDRELVAKGLVADGHMHLAPQAAQ
ncbi:hypothetical protein [Pacificoceanicola onchidii]|uniref:hypothetical protein n=1 Tax=Pacificoceanicola onchidii TaxID=2562685 RepID=UPI0010A4AA68|nr:hypothetical protein [Pacificoceanicola onchidii]